MMVLERFARIFTRLCFAASFMAASAGFASAQVSVPVPYTLSFVPVPLAPGTAMHSYCVAEINATTWIVLGGRLQGLHQFNATGNFAGPNTQIWTINPSTGSATPIVDITQISPQYGDPLMATNQECEYHPESGDWYIVGGYGLNRQTNNYATFPTIARIPAQQLLQLATDTKLTAVKKAAAIKALLEIPSNQITNPAMKVTGGALSHMASGVEFLAFGQSFDGNYNPFGGGFVQKYTQAVQPFTIQTSPTFAINLLAPITSADADSPYNRRDFASGYDVDPTTGQERFAVFGGVFPPGKIAAYDYPVYITGSNFSVSVNPDRSVTQHFGAYEQPVITVWDGSQVYHTFFGAISHWYLNQSPAQAAVYQYVTGQGRNDGLPFVADIATLIENNLGQYSEFVSTDPIPNNMLHGASVDFFPNTALTGKFQGTGNSVVNLSSFQPGEKELIGYIYGGIEATNPLPCQPSHGTVASSTMYQVYLTYTPWTNLIPASQANEANPQFNHGDPTVPAGAKPAAKPTAVTSPNPCPTQTSTAKKRKKAGK
jgi:hypothetical protein